MQPDQAQWKLTISDGPEMVGDTYPLAGETFSIGRELDNDLPLDDLQISRYHARLTQQDAEIVFEDLGSANGTSINSEPLLEPRVLQPNDRITMGSFTLVVEESLQPDPQSLVQTVVNPTPAPVHTPSPPPPPPAPSKTGPTLLIVVLIFAVLIVTLLVILGLGWFFVGGAGEVSTLDAPDGGTVVVMEPTIIVSQAPSQNAQIPVNQSVTMQAVASDPAGITRMELWINGLKEDEISSSLAQQVTSMATLFQWTTDRPGTYALEIRAYTGTGLSSSTEVATITVIGDPPTAVPVPSATPTPTITPLPPTATPTSAPTATQSPTPLPPTATPVPAAFLVTETVLNVRAGPGTQYEVVGRLLQDTRAEIAGQANSSQGQWWQIRFNNAPGGLGWVSGNPTFATVSNTGQVPLVNAPLLPTATQTTAPTSTATPTEVVAVATIIYAPDNKTLLFVSNRSSDNQPTRFTLSGGKSVGGGREIDVAPGGEVEIVLEPDFYRALWSTTARGGFARGADFTAVAGKVMVMWIIPEDGLTMTELYDQLTISGGASATPAVATATPVSLISTGLVAPSGRALLMADNRSSLNNFAVLTVSGGSFGGGQQITLDANTENPLELLPGSYRAIWTTPANGGFSAGRDFTVSAGEVILSWIIPEDGQVFMQFPGQPVIQINN